jgi:Restriction endonuclease
VTPFPLDHLTETEFEEFCFDLLKALEATKISWRKGTGHDSSPADQGRDIECHFRRKDIDGHMEERWFVECKHYKQGVPPEKLQGLLSWASAERPDVVLIIASNFLSNPAKNNLEAFERNNKPAFKIKIWERPDLERFVLGKPLVMRKYGLGSEFEFLNILHPAHVAYLRRPGVNTIDYFFGLLDNLETEERRSFLFGSFISVINPQFEEPTDPKRQSIGELAKAKMTYAEFRNKCYELAYEISPHFLIQAIVFHELASAFGCGDLTSIQQTRENMKQSLSFFEEKLKWPHPDPETIKACIRDMKKGIEQVEERTNANYERYCSFCDKVVAPLLKEQLPMPEGVKKLIEEEARWKAEHGKEGEPNT